MSPILPFHWNQKREQAAVLVADDRQSDTEIAAELGIDKRTLERWKQTPEFAARVADHTAAFREAVLSQGIADKVNRVRALDTRWKLLQQVITERAAAPEMQSVPGGKTGLLVKSYKRIGSGQEAITVEEYSVDTALLAELRALEKQAAQEVGQWVERGQHDVTSGGRPISYADLMELHELSEEELDRRIADADALKHERSLLPAGEKGE